MTVASRLCSLVALAATLPLLAHGAPDPSSAGRSRDYTLRLAPGRVAPDGFEREALLVSGKTPGPLIKGNMGDVLNINVINALNNENLHHSSSVHWHGLHVKNRNYNDGASTVTQCPITPDHAYEYQVPTNDQFGTFWYHSHFSSQYCDGLRGPLVVYNPNDPHKNLYDVDDESTIMSLVDWYATPAKIAYHPGPDVAAPRPNSTLINGLGIRHKTNGQSGSLAIYNVKPNTRYRIRLINMACDPGYTFSIDGHTLKVIEADSIEVKPVDVDGLNIFAGQRYSFVLNTNQKPGNYWIRALPNRAVEQTYAFNINTAILRYKGAPIALPPVAANDSYPQFTKFLIESALEPLVDVPVPGVHELGKADVSMTLTTVPHPELGVINLGDDIYRPPAVPVLLQILSGARTKDDFLSQGSLYTLPPNKTIEIILPGEQRIGPHPFHLHGHDFWVIKPVDGEAPKWTNVIRRDTLSAGKGNQSAILRFTTDNPGPWFLHCHIDWHLDAGMGVVFVEDSKTTANNQKGLPTKQWDNLCKVYNKYKDDGGED